MAGAPRIPRGPTDPDNPRSPNYRPPATPRENPTRPGLPFKSTAQELMEYDEWWADTGWAWSKFMEANPDQADWIKKTAWTYREDSNIVYDRFTKKGLNDPTGPTSGSRGRGGGGGGGGVSKAQQYTQAEAAIRNMTRTLGLELGDASIKAVAKTAVDNNWSDDMLSDYFAPQAQTTTNPGTITALVAQIQNNAAKQLLTVSESTAREWASRIASNEMSEESITALFQTQAAQRYGWAADQINQGLNVRDILLPTRDRIANELEMNPEQIDLMDPKWLSMVQTSDDKTGAVRAATDSEAIMRARKDPQWARTRNATALAGDVSTMLRDIFGG